jgi:hypothetical protein
MTLAEKRAVLQDIKQRHGGRVTARIVVDEARSPDHPFHQLFPWNDEATADKFRLMIARQLIRSIEVEIVRTPEGTHHREPVSIEFVRDPAATPKEQGYVAVTTAAQSTATTQAVLLAQLARIESEIVRYLRLAQ